MQVVHMCTAMQQQLIHHVTDTLFLVCSTLCDPYLNLFRGIIPPLNGTIDLSPILAFVALDVGLLLLPAHDAHMQLACRRTPAHVE